MESEQLVTVEVINNNFQTTDVDDLADPSLQVDVSNETFQGTIVVQPEDITTDAQVSCCHCNVTTTLSEQIKLNSTLPQIDPQFSLAMAFEELGYHSYKESDFVCKECLELLVTSIQLKRDLERTERKLRFKCATVQTTSEEIEMTVSTDNGKVYISDEKPALKQESENPNEHASPDKKIVKDSENQKDEGEPQNTGDITPEKTGKRGRKKKTQVGSEKNKEMPSKQDTGKTKGIENTKEKIETSHFICKDCKKTFKFDLYLQKHIILKHKNGCKFCRKTFTNEKKLASHLKIEHKNDQFPYSCTQCGKKFRKCQYLDNHLHIHFETYRCAKCLKCFKDLHDLQIHYQRKKLHELADLRKRRFAKSENVDTQIPKETAKTPAMPLGSSEETESNTQDPIGDEEVSSEHQKSAAKEITDKDAVASGIETMHEDYTSCLQKEDITSPLDMVGDVDVEKSALMSDDEVCNTEVSQVEPCDVKPPADLDDESDIEPRKQLTRRSKRSNKVAQAMLALIPKKRQRKDSSDFEEPSPVKMSKPTFKMPDITPKIKTPKTKSKRVGCAWCTEKFDNEELLKKHLEEHKFVCKFCHQEFIDGDSLLEHEETHVEEIQPYACPICTKKFKVCSHLDRHMGYHTDKYSCHLCSKNFMDSYDLLRHGKSMHKIDQNSKKVCNLCLQCFESKEELKLHTSEHEKSEIAYICRECESKPKFTNIDDLMDHLKKCEFYLASPYSKPHPSGLKKEGKRPYVCTVCHKTFEKMVTLKQHLVTHSDERKFKCTMCDKAFKRSHHLKDHINSHTQERRFLCEKCPQAFLTNNALKMHMMIHNGVWRFECQICQKKFRNIGGLKVHMRSHTGERPFICDQCGRSFICKQTLQFHMATHTGERKYACSLCYRTFSNPKVAKNHLHTHNTEKRFECDICHNFFKMPATLYKHKRKVHKVVSARRQLNNVQDFVVIQEVLPETIADDSTHVYEFCKREDELLQVTDQPTEIHLVPTTE